MTQVKSKAKAKIKVDENFENFKNDISKNKVEAQVKVKANAKDKAEIEVNEDIEKTKIIVKKYLTRLRLRCKN